MQVVAMIVLLPLFGIAPIKVMPDKYFGNFSTLNGTSPANITYYKGVNLWIGPSASSLIQFGAKFTPCMRTDFGIRRRNSILYNPDNLGCCRNGDHIGTVPIEQCSAAAIATTNSNVSGYQVNVLCSGNQSIFFLPTFHPCCVSITGLCIVTSFEECKARNGFFHLDIDSCVEVRFNLFSKLCILYIYM